MLSALYYPHIEIRNPSLIKTALLLWDKIEYISPDRGWTAFHQDNDLQKALDLIAEPHVPSNEEKLLAHKAILELSNSDLPDWFFLERIKEGVGYGIYPQKLLSETFHSLEESKLVKEKGETFITSSAFGFSVMSILADCCAGSQKQLITDEVKSYSALNKYLTNIAGGDYRAENKDIEQYDRLATISLKTVNVDELDIKRLISAREREKKGDYVLRSFRHNYLKSLEDCVNRITKDARTEEDKKEIERYFEQETERDLKELKDELKIEAKKTLLSTEILFTVQLAAGLIVNPVITSAIGIGALLKKKVEYKETRNKTLKNHNMSWLYLTQRNHLL